MGKNEILQNFGVDRLGIEMRKIRPVVFTKTRQYQCGRQCREKNGDDVQYLVCHYRSPLFNRYPLNRMRGQESNASSARTGVDEP